MTSRQPTDLSDDYVEEELPRERGSRSRARLLKKTENRKRNDDPYYCGFAARVPQLSAKKTNTPRERAASREVPSRSRVISPPRVNSANISQLPGPR